MNEVRCSGFEKSVTECQFNKDALGCSHEEDAAVRCNVPAMGFQETVIIRSQRRHKRTKTNRVGGKLNALLLCTGCCAAAASERRPDSLRGPRGGSDGEERFSGVGHGVQRGLGNHGGHGGLSPAGPGLCQQRLSGEGRRQNMEDTRSNQSLLYNPATNTLAARKNEMISSLNGS